MKQPTWYFGFERKKYFSVEQGNEDGIFLVWPKDTYPLLNTLAKHSAKYFKYILFSPHNDPLRYCFSLILHIRKLRQREDHVTCPRFVVISIEGKIPTMLIRLQSKCYSTSYCRETGIAECLLCSHV